MWETEAVILVVYLATAMFGYWIGTRAYMRAKDAYDRERHRDREVGGMALGAMVMKKTMKKTMTIANNADLEMRRLLYLAAQHELDSEGSDFHEERGDFS